MATKTGAYTNKADGKDYQFTFEVPDTLQEFRELVEGGEVSEDEMYTLAYRMYITDARNQASAQAQASAGHNQRTLTTEEKEIRKQQAKADRALLAKLKGMSHHQLKELGLA